MPTASPRPAPLYRPLIFVLGALASYLLLLSEAVAEKTAVIAYGVLALIILIYAASLIGPTKKAEVRENRRAWSRWLTISLAVLGFGLGISAYIYRLRLKTLVDNIQSRMDTTQGVFLASLIFLGPP